MPSFILNNYKIIGFMAGMVFLVLTGWTLGVRHEKNKQKANIIAAQANVIKKDEQSTTLFNQIGGHYADQIKANLAEYYSNPVSVPTSPYIGVSKNVTPSIGIAAATCARKLRACNTNLKNADAEVEDLQDAYNGQMAIINK
jgi:hypothetical protein